MIRDMWRRTCGVLLGAVLTMPAWAGSLTLSGMADTDHGRSIELTGRYAPTESLTLGASLGRSSATGGASDVDFSGTSFGASADLDIDGFFADASADRWQDSGNLRSTVLHGELGWMSQSGVALSALVASRAMRVTYTATLLGQTRERTVDFSGTGFGADFSYYGAVWNAGVRFLDYSYGSSVSRVRQLLESGSTTRFPRLQRLISSMATRAAGAPDREASAVLGRQFPHASLSADLAWERDALTGDKTKSAGLTLGLAPTRRWGVNVSAGLSRSGEAGTVSWAGLALTLRSAK
jgi:hypothetical protein